jgi:hypothetical protein
MEDKTIPVIGAHWVVCCVGLQQRASLKHRSCRCCALRCCVLCVLHFFRMLAVCARGHAVHTHTNHNPFTTMTVEVALRESSAADPAEIRARVGR